MTEEQKKYYNAMKKLGSKKPQKPIPRPSVCWVNHPGAQQGGSTSSHQLSPSEWEGFREDHLPGQGAKSWLPIATFPTGPC